jgi:putative tryptophan/tyrosine transport system substrate-binding protein
MNRRELIVTLGGAAAWSLAARAQSDRMGRVGVLMAVPNDPVGRALLAAFQEGFRKLGWADGRNVRIDTRWATDADRLGSYAAELVELRPDAIVAGATGALVPLKQATQTIPIVFAQVSDPIHGGFVQSLSHPSGNITGFALYEYSIAVKWMELLKDIAPSVTRVAVIYDPTNVSNTGQLPEAKAAALSFSIQPSAFAVRDAAEIERAIEEFAPGPNGGLVVLPNPITAANRSVIISLAAKYHLPDIYAYRFHVASGGLASYGIDLNDLYQRAASYVDRILKGEKPSEMPVQFADKFELVINLKTAKMLGLDPPISLLARTDEVIE